MVPVMGARRHVVGQVRRLREVGAGHLRQGLSYAYTCGHRRIGLPRAVHAESGTLHSSADAKGTIETIGLPRRRSLGAEATEQLALVQDVSRLGGLLGEKVKVIATVILGLIFVGVIALFATSAHTALALTP